MTSIRWLGSPTCSAASPTSHRAGLPNCCHGIGNIRTCGWPLELWRPSPTSSRSGVLPRSWATMKTCYGSCPTSSSPKTGSCGFTISMALKPPPSPTMASRLFAKLSRIRSIAPVNLQTSVPRCSAYAYEQMAGEARSRERYSEAFWRTHHEAWRQSDLNQREYCEAQGLSLKAFGNWRAKFKAEPQQPPRKLLLPTQQP